jgi:glycosyltransferase involved in cell wall biosynthesis
MAIRSPPEAGNRRRALFLTGDRDIDRRILRFADALDEGGWSTSILAMPADRPGHDDPRVVRLGARGGDAAALAGYRWLRALLPANGPVMGRIKQLAMHWIFDPERFFERLFLPAAQDWACDVVVAVDLPLLSTARRVAQARGARLVYDSHELYSEQEFPPLLRRRWRMIETRHIGACDAVVTVNPSIAAELERLHGLHGVHVVLSAEPSAGAPADTRRIHARLGLAPQRRVLLYQGGLSAHRNLASLVRAMDHVRDQAVELVFLGDGPMRGRLGRLARAGLRARRIHFLPRVSQETLLAWTASADLGVIPYRATSLNTRLCTPNKLFEFIAARVPVLASDLPELRRLVVQEGIGMVGEMESPQAIAALIDDALGDPSRIARWREQLAHTRERICWEVEAPRVRAIFEGVACAC